MPEDASPSSAPDQPRRRPPSTVRRHVRRVTLAILGFPLLVAGLVTLPTPLPFGIILIPAGLIILSFEFAFAIRTLEWLEDHLGVIGRNMRRLRHQAERLALRIAGKAGVAPEEGDRHADTKNPT